MRQTKESALYAAAAALPAAVRTDFLNRHCPSELRAAIELRLAALDSGGSVGGAGATATAGGVAGSFPENASGATIGRYRLIERLGEGGWGIVYLAEQSQPVRRLVALKLIKPGMDSQAVIARFEAERQALALMDHSHIAKVLDAGTNEAGRPYFVMEFVRGAWLTQYCERHRVSTTARLELFIKICLAIQHAHQKGVIHRDLKPSNILVSDQDGVLTPKVIDFGIAKAVSGRLAEGALVTLAHQFIGTPAYVSPEQAEISGSDIDTRSDIYSLGVLLYELLTGGTPFDSELLLEKGLDEARRVIREVEPPRPSARLAALKGNALDVVAGAQASDASRLPARIRGDLDWIVMTCLEKDRARRYQTASALATDLQRHLSHQPISARPPSAVYQVQKAFRRHRFAFSAGIAVAGALVLGTVVSVSQTLRALRAERDAIARAERGARLEELVRHLFLGVQPDDANDAGATLLRRLLAQTESQLLSDPKVATPDEGLARAIARTYQTLGDPRSAERLQRRILGALEKAGRAQTMDEALVLSELGLTLQSMGREAESTNALSTALGIAERQRRRFQPGLSAVLVELAGVYNEIGEARYAEGLIADAVKQLTRLYGANAADTLVAKNRLAVTYFREGKIALAGDLAVKVLLLQKELVGPDDPETLRTMHLLAAIRQSEGKFKAAEALQSECLQRRRQALGANNPATLASMDDLAIVYSYEGRYRSAELLERAACAAHLKQFGERHRDTLAMKNNLAEHLRNQNRFSESEALYQEVIGGLRSIFTDYHPLLLEAQNGLAILYCFEGRHEAARKISQAVIAACRRRGAAADSQLAAALEREAVSCLALGRFDEAEAAAAECLRLRTAGDAPPSLRLGAEGLLGLSRAGKGRIGEAEENLDRAYQGLKWSEASLPAIDRERIAEVLAGLVAIYEKTGRPTLAAESRDELAKRQSEARVHNRLAEDLGVASEKR